MSLTNKEIRAHLRKGELAVELLEKLGYRWEPNVNRGPAVWQEPEKNSLLCKLEELIASEVEKQKPSPVRERVLTAGERFTIDLLTPGHKLAESVPDYRRKVWTARKVEFGTGPCRGLIVRFGTGPTNSGFWLPLTHVTRIPNNDNF